ncbi:MAG: DUF72 domain-containing protein, partial [Chloroflexi bacterium]
HWKGDFYPENVPKSRWFDYYLTKFNSVEINATFYRTFKDQTYEKWRERVSPSFLYVLKTPRLITHRKHLLDVENDIKEFSRSASILEDRLGLILLQLAPQTVFDLERLRGAILAFGDPARVAVEFRNEKWLKEETFNLLKELGAVYCDVDSPNLRPTGLVTSSSGYIRLHGPNRWYSSNYSDEELADTARLAVEMHTRGAKRVFIYFNNDVGGYAPRNALQLMQYLGKSVFPESG